MFSEAKRPQASTVLIIESIKKTRMKSFERSLEITNKNKSQCSNNHKQLEYNNFYAHTD